VSESAELLRMLRRIRLRARGLAAVEGAVAGAAFGLTAVALAALAWRARGGPVPWRAAVIASAAAAALGAALAAARPVSLVRCARLLDAAMDRGGPARDRALSALSFASASGFEGAPLARAALADAIARARVFAPAFVAPARQPRGLLALGAAALALFVVGAWPARAPGARRGAGATLAAEAEEPRVHVEERALDAERAEIVAAATAAEAAGDVSLRALAREARAALDALADGALGRGEALERLTALAARAKESADEADAARAGLRAAGKALDQTAATRPLGHALAGDDTDATSRALDALAERAGASESARAGIADALAAAAAGVAGAASDDDGPSPGEGRRRLNREREASGGAASDGVPPQPSPPSARRLEHLRRDLDDAADGCRGDAARCAEQLRGGASGLQGAAREASESPARRRLENAVRQMRERLRRGDLEQGSTERRFARAARGEKREGAHGAAGGERGTSKGDEGTEGVLSDDPSSGDGEGGQGQDVFVEDPSSESGGATASAGESASGGSSADGEGDGAPVAGNGAGRQAGGDPLGRSATPPTRGHEREVRLRGGAGPTRSEVIEASARRGFATRDYVRVFGDYEAVVEESLASGAVPEGRRYVVRRYFQLIRPRAGAPRAP
jgi:hypothetical protein